MSEPLIDLESKVNSIDNVFDDAFGDILTNNEFREKKNDSKKQQNAGESENVKKKAARPKQSEQIENNVIPNSPVQTEESPAKEYAENTVVQSSSNSEEKRPNENNAGFFGEPQAKPAGRKTNVQEIKRLKKDPEVFIIFHKEDKPKKNKMIPEQGSERSLTEQAALSRKGSESTSLLDGEMCFKLKRIDNNDEVILNRPVVRIGKSSKFADYVITDNTAVSRRHAELISKNGKCYVRDKNSTNGTFIDGYQLPPESETEIKSGQILTIANVEFRFS